MWNWKKKKSVDTYKLPDVYIYEGTSSDGLKVKVMAKNYAEALALAGGNGCDIAYIGVQVGLTITTA